MDDHNLQQLAYTPDGVFQETPAAVIADRKEYFEYYMPRKNFNNILTAISFLPVSGILLGVLIALGEGAYSLLFLAHAIISIGLAVWMKKTYSVASTVCALVYSVVFFVVSLIVISLGYWLTILLSALALAAVVKGNELWRGYQAMPSQSAPLSDDEKERTDKKNRRFSIILIVLCAVLVLVAGVVTALYIAEEQQYADYTVGEVRDGTYVNSFADVTFKVPDRWELYDAEALEAMNQEMFALEYDPEEYACIMYADYSYSQQDTAEYEYAALFVSKMGRLKDARSYVDDLSDSNDWLYGDMIESEERLTATVGGQEYDVLHTVYGYELDDGTTGTYDEYILVRSIGRYVFEIYLYPVEDQSYESLLSCFE